MRRGLGVKEVVAHTGAQNATTRLGKIWFIHCCVKIVRPRVLFASTLTLSCWAVAARKREADKRAHVTEGISLMLLVCVGCCGAVCGVRGGTGRV